MLFDLEGGELVAVSAWKNWIYLQLWLRSHAPQWLGTTHVYRFILGRLTGSDPFGTLPSDDLDHQIEWQIAKMKEKDLNARDLDMACRIVAGTARSCGIEVKD